MTVHLDHIVVSAVTRDAGGAHVTRLTGATMGMGGEHDGIGTHNLLCQLGGNVFLEAIARNPDRPGPGRPLWYGLDTPPDPPRLSAWVLNTDNIAATLAAGCEAGVDLGTACPAQRGALTWSFAFPPLGNSELGGAAPYVMQWNRPDPHPSAGMADAGLRLTRLTVATPMADRLNSLLQALEFSDERVEVRQADALRLTAQLIAPDGRDVTLS